MYRRSYASLKIDAQAGAVGARTEQNRARTAEITGVASFEGRGRCAVGANCARTANDTGFAINCEFSSFFFIFFHSSFPYPISSSPKPFFLRFQVPNGFQSLQGSYHWTSLVDAELLGQAIFDSTVVEVSPSFINLGFLVRLMLLKVFGAFWY